KALTARGVVRALACCFLVMVFDAAMPSPAFAQAPAADASAFAAAWQNGTPTTVTGELTVIYADDFKSHRSELVHMIRDERTGKSERYAACAFAGRTVTGAVKELVAALKYRTPMLLGVTLLPV